MLESATGDPRQTLVDLGRRLVREGLVRGTSGNLSARLPDGAVLVTPSGVDYATMSPDDLVVVDADGSVLDGRLKPSIDTHNHLAIYRARPDVGGVAHTHSPYATAFSTLPEPIPAFVAETAGYLGGPVRVMAYLPPGRPELADRLSDALAADRAILLPNHGVVAVGESPTAAVQAAEAVEEAARIAWLARQLGQPRVVPDKEIRRLNEFIRHRYGQRDEPGCASGSAGAVVRAARRRS
jgi:L-ribulose-5-phosphate 4-epimerase